MQCKRDYPKKMELMKDWGNKFMLRIYRIEYGEKKKLEWIKRNVKLLELWWPKEDLDKAVGN